MDTLKEHKELNEIGISLPVIVSLTTYSKRVATVDRVICTMLNQTVNVSKVILYLSKVDFANSEEKLPEQLLNYVGDRFEICFCDDIGPHTKYYYAMQQYPESIIITVDDDIYYPSDIVETLLNSYMKYNYAVSAMRGHLIEVDNDGNILPYNQWKNQYKGVGHTSMALFATGVGGVLYPPGCMSNELFNLDSIKSLCPKADDLWLKIMQIISNTPVVLASPSNPLKYIENTQQDGLWHTNVSESLNDKQLHSILNCYNEYFGKYDTLINRLTFACKNFAKAYPNIKNDERIIRASELKSFEETIRKLNSRSKKLEETIKKLNDELLNLKHSKTYVLGKCITFLPRKIKNFTVCYKEHGANYTFNRIKEKIKVLFDRWL